MTGAGSSGDPAAAARAFWNAEPASALAELAREPYRFDFFQAVRLVALAVAHIEHPSDDRQTVPTPYEEHLRFRTDVGHGFPASAIGGLVVPASDGSAAVETPVPEMLVTFLGLAGTAGILPWHYTQLLIDRLREKDVGIRDFFDLFNHRAIAQFYRAWERSHFYVGYESARRHGVERTDTFTQIVFSLVGLGTPGLRNRQSISDDALLYYSGHFSHRPRSAAALVRIIRDVFRLPAEIRQFEGQWMYLQRGDRTQLRRGASNQLGVSAIAGARVWGIENKFRVRLTIAEHACFERFMPGGPSYTALGQVVRTFVGPSFDFDLQILLAKAVVPRCRLSRRGGVRLGWNSWLFSGAATRDVDDAVFDCAGMHVRESAGRA